MNSEFEAFYQARFESTVRKAMRAVGGNRADAEDIAAASFAELWRAWDMGKAYAPEALLATICKRQTIRHWRRQPAAHGVVLVYESYEADCPGGPDPADVVELADSARRALAALEPGQQRIALARAAGATTAEIAAAAGVSVEEIRAAIRRHRTVVAARAAVSCTGAEADQLVTFAQGLPTRQRHVFALACNGYWPAEIARYLEVSSNDVRVTLCIAKKKAAAAVPHRTYGEALEKISLIISSARALPRWFWLEDNETTEFGRAMLAQDSRLHRLLHSEADIAA